MLHVRDKKVIHEKWNPFLSFILEFSYIYRKVDVNVKSFTVEIRPFAIIGDLVCKKSEKISHGPSWPLTIFSEIFLNKSVENFKVK